MDDPDLMGFESALAAAAALDEAALALPWTFRDRTMSVRYALYRTLEDAQEAHVVVAARPHGEARRILAFAQRAFGDLRGLLIGLPEDLLDRPPRQGEWPIREVLGHMLTVERRYAIQTRYAVDRTDAEPVRIPDDRLLPGAQMDVSGGIGDLLALIGAARAETNRSLGAIAPSDMTRRTVWANYDVDVRFRLHRFAAHVVEHAIQCEKTLDALGYQPAEGRRIVRQLAALVGEIEGLGALAEAREVQRRLAERLATAP